VACWIPPHATGSVASNRLLGELGVGVSGQVGPVDDDVQVGEVLRHVLGHDDAAVVVDATVRVGDEEALEAEAAGRARVTGRGERDVDGAVVGQALSEGDEPVGRAGHEAAGVDRVARVGVGVDAGALVAGLGVAVDVHRVRLPRREAGGGEVDVEHAAREPEGGVAGRVRTAVGDVVVGDGVQGGVEVPGADGDGGSRREQHCCGEGDEGGDSLLHLGFLLLCGR
jgi:hypothetical protein